MTRQRTLHDPATGKTWATRCDGAQVVVTAGAPGKEKHSEKPHADARAALAWAQKEEWARLKKGHRLVDRQAAPGQPRLQLFLGKDYTGALVAASFEGRLLCNRYDPEAEGDELLLIDADGGIAQRAAVPDHLVWKAVDAPALGRVLLNVDHRPMAWTPGRDAPEALAGENDTPASFLSVAGTRAAWFDEPALVVHELAQGRELLRHPLAPEQYSGHSEQMEGALSPDGATVACCSRAGEVQLIDVASGAVTATWRGGFEMIEKLAFSADGRWLLALEQYGAWTLHAFDVAAGAPRADWPKLGDLSNADFALDAAGTRLALGRRGQVQVFALDDMRVLQRFAVDHALKRFALCWLGEDAIGVRTDLGCAAVYALG